MRFYLSYGSMDTILMIELDQFLGFVEQLALIEIEFLTSVKFPKNGNLEFVHIYV